MKYGIRLDCTPEFWYQEHHQNPHWTRTASKATAYDSFDEALDERSRHLALYRTIVVPIQ